MKKIKLIVLLAVALISSSLSAQRLRIAILDLRAGVGMTQSQVDGLSDMLSVELFNSGYFTVVERTQLNAVLSANNIKPHTDVTESQRKIIGNKLNVEAVLIGTVNFIQHDTKTASDGTTKVRVGQYNVDIRLVSTSTGELVSAAGGRRNNVDNDRKLMTEIARELARNLDKSIQNSSAQVNVLSGFLYVFPTDLGLFTANPSTIIDITNRQMLYGYSDWRLPTKEEYGLMAANAKLLHLDPSVSYAFDGAWNHSSNELAVRLVRSKVIVQQDDAYSTDKVYFSKVTHNFGSIPILNGAVSTKFCLKNASNENVSIKNVSKTNSNLNIEYSIMPISPGEESCIVVSYNPNGRQGTVFNNKIIVTLSNGKQFTLNVSGKVI